MPEKVGLKAVQRDNVDYEFTAVLDIAMNHHATASKDRTGLFVNRTEFAITPKVIFWLGALLFRIFFITLGH